MSWWTGILFNYFPLIREDAEMNCWTNNPLKFSNIHFYILIPCSRALISNHAVRLGHRVINNIEGKATQIVLDGYFMSFDWKFKDNITVARSHLGFPAIWKKKFWTNLKIFSFCVISKVSVQISKTNNLGEKTTSKI